MTEALGAVLYRMGWSTAADLARSLGVDPDALADLLADYDVIGYVQTREEGGVVSVALTDEGVETLCTSRVDSGRARDAKREAAGDVRCDRMGYPLSSVLIGTGMVWDNRGYATCPACGGGRLRPHEYCLYCDAWGLSELEPAWNLDNIRKQRTPSTASSPRGVAASS